MGEETKFFQRKEFLAGEGRRRRSLTYYLYAPAKPYPPGLKFPLVLVLHDVHGSADAAQYLIEGDMPLKHPAFVVVPVLPFYKKWAMPQDFPEMQGFEPLETQREGLPEAIQLVQQLRDDYPIDPGRIYAIGCSDGGFGAFAAALHYPNLFAAAVPIGSGWTGQDARGFAKVPLWIFHGGQDNFYAPELSRNAATYINAYGGKANYTEVPYVGHDCENGQFYRSALWEWLFSQHKKS
jgi:predicted peptidase